MGSSRWIHLIYITNCFYIFTVISTLFDTAYFSYLFIFFWINLVAPFILDEGFNCSNSLSLTHVIKREILNLHVTSLNYDKASQIEIFTKQTK